MSTSFKTEEDVIKDSIKNQKPTVERDLITAKTFLKQQSNGGENVYDHLASILSKIIDERPKNVMDNFEELNRTIRAEKNRNSNTLATTYVEPDNLKGANSFVQCFNTFSNLPIEEHRSVRIDDFVHLQFYWSLIGYGFPQGLLFTMACSLGILQNKIFVRKCRYWGRIFGIKLNYFIAEAELSDDEIKKRLSGDGGGESNEQWGSGLNQKTYFVCHCLGDEWIELPKVTSKDIEMSQKIRKHFTGDLNSEIQSNPKFVGSEKNLLRATIQRITTETYAAPIGYYSVDEGKLSVNPNYNPIEESKLLELTSWCRYRATKTPLCSENSSNPIPTWTIRHIHEHFPETSSLLIRSNIWPGSVSFCSRLVHDSLYIGWGVKYSSKAFIPPLPLSTSQEYDFNVKTVNDEMPGTFPVNEKQNEKNNSVAE